MYSIIEDEDQGMVKVIEKKIAESDVCRKCQTNHAEIILRAKDLYCRPCFLAYFAHKFRSTIGKSKEIKPGDKILIGLSGGLSSMALLHLIRNGFNDDIPKQLKFNASVLFINESVICDDAPSTSIICQEVQKLNFPFYYTFIEEVLQNEALEISVTSLEESHTVPNADSPQLSSSSLRDKLNDLLSTHLKSRTSREDMIFHLRNELICRCAKQLSFQKVFLGTNSTELSVRILTDIAVGRGSQLGDHVQFKTTQFGVQLFRPMRELLDDEVRHFVHCQKIFIPHKDSQSSNEESAPSVVSRTKNFLSGLQKEFVSTVPTVFKTGGKLVSGSFSSNNSVMTSETTASSNVEKLFPSSAENNYGRSSSHLEGNDAIQAGDLCLFCGLYRDRTNSAVSAVESIRISKALSTGKTLGATAGEAASSASSNKISGDSANDVLETCRQQGDRLIEETFKYFCYGCANLFREVRNIGSFPHRIRERLKEKRQEDVALIQDCLIENSP